MGINLQPFDPGQMQRTITSLIKWAPLLTREITKSDVADLDISWTDWDNNLPERITNNYPHLKITSKSGNTALLKELTRYLRNLALPVSNWTNDKEVPPHLELYAESDGIGHGVTFSYPTLQRLMEGGFDDYYNVIRKLNQLAGADLNDTKGNGCAEFLQHDIISLKTLPDGSPDLVISINLGRGWQKPFQKTDEAAQAYFERKTNAIFRFRDELNKTLGTELKLQSDFLTRHYDVYYDDYSSARDYTRKGKPTMEGQPERMRHAILDIPVAPLLANLKSVNALLDKYIEPPQRGVARA